MLIYINMAEFDETQIIENYSVMIRGFVNSGVNPAFIDRSIFIPFNPDAVIITDFNFSSSGVLDYRFYITTNLPLLNGIEQPILNGVVFSGTIQNHFFDNTNNYYLIDKGKNIDGVYRFSWFDINDNPMSYAGNILWNMRFVKFKSDI